MNPEPPCWEEALAWLMTQARQPHQRVCPCFPWGKPDNTPCNCGARELNQAVERFGLAIEREIIKQERMGP